MKETREGNRPPRRVYKVTAKGEAEYQKMLRQNLAAFIETKFPGDVGLGFADDLDPGEVLPLLAERHAALVAKLAELNAVPEHSGSLQLIVSHQQFHLEAELRWIGGPWLLGRLTHRRNRSCPSTLPRLLRG